MDEITKVIGVDLDEYIELKLKVCKFENDLANARLRYWDAEEKANKLAERVKELEAQATHKKEISIINFDDAGVDDGK